MVEQDVIGHLMDVERLASDLLAEAHKEADRRKAEAKEQAERKFLSEYEKIIAVLESSHADEKAEIDNKRDREYSGYAEYLSSKNRDQAALNAWLDAFFAGK
jgi:hypothetical protein